MRLRELSRNNIIGSGEDSVVYRKGEKVIKIYPRDDYGRLLKIYNKLTRVSRTLFEKNKIKGELVISGKKYSYEFEVIPIEDMGITEEGKQYTIAEYVPGVRISSIVPDAHSDSAQQSNDYYRDILLIKNQIKQAWFHNLRRELCTDYELRIDFEEALNLAEERLGKVNDREVYFSAPNVKIDVDLRKKHIRFAITDVCASIHRL